MMTRTDFQILAQALLTAKKEINSEASRKYREVVISEVAAKLKTAYPRFNAEYFIRAADGQHDYQPPRGR